MSSLLVAAAFAATATATAGATANLPPRSIDPVIQKVEQMPWDANVTALAHRVGLNVVNVTWEDTGRFAGSAVGPNISDMTIGVRDSNGALHPMPVLRFDNFSDKTADLRADRFLLPVGNAWGAEELNSVSLTEVLQDTRRFLHDPKSWAGGGRSLWNARDAHVLVSAQACFLPVPRAGEATFTPVLYNYQSSPNNPAVLTIVATREGTSIQVIENEGGYMSEPLFFNDNGERAPFVAARLSDVQSGRVDLGGTAGALAANGEDDGNVVLVIQVPLKQKAVDRWVGYGGGPVPSAAPMAESAQPKGRAMDSDVEVAVVGHGKAEGPYKEIDRLAIERDTRFPVRVTVQFYQATSNGVVSEADIQRLKRQIDRVYRDAAYVGSLVTEPTTGRPTDWRAPQQPALSSTTPTWAAPHWGALKAF